MFTWWTMPVDGGLPVPRHARLRDVRPDLQPEGGGPGRRGRAEHLRRPALRVEALLRGRGHRGRGDAVLLPEHVRRDYGTAIIDGPLAGLCARAVLVLDEQNQVVHAELVPDIVEEPDYDAALAALY